MIEVKNLFFKYSIEQENWTLKNINVKFENGKYIAILGHNGSGKSTLSKILVGILKPQEGEVKINDLIMSKQTLREIRKYIGIIFQNPDNQFVGATVEDDIAFGLENRRIEQKEMRKIIEELSTKVGMIDHLEREPQNLSGGQKQRVAIASILALNPEIIIFDEVTSMLDPKGKHDVLNIIREIQSKKDKILISITHDMDEAILADELLVLSNGEVIAQGSPQEILRDKKIIEIAKIDSPFIYKLSEKIKNINPTYDENELLEEICK